MQLAVGEHYGKVVVGHAGHKSDDSHMETRCPGQRHLCILAASPAANKQIGTYCNLHCGGGGGDGGGGCIFYVVVVVVVAFICGAACD